MLIKFIILVVIAFVITACNDREALAKCEKTHSKETCIHTLFR